MSRPVDANAPRHAPESGDPTIGALVERLVEQTATLVRDEMRHAQVEYSAKARQAGTGLGMFGAGGLLALYGLAALVAAAVSALALVLPLWAAAVVVAAVLLAAAAAVSLAGKKRVREATPATPQRTLASIKTDITEVKEQASHDTP